MLVNVQENLYVGDQTEDGKIDTIFALNAIVYAAKEPWHRNELGYTTKAAPKDDPDYYWAERGNMLMLNMVDAPKPEFFDKRMIDKALDYIEQKQKEMYRVIILCNQGQSRSASLALLHLIRQGIITGDTLEDCEVQFLRVYPNYNPGEGMRGFVKLHWEWYKKENIDTQSQ